MPTSFVKIYERSISSMDDPSITSAFEKSPISFFKIMYTYLVNAIPSFNIPIRMQLELAKRTDPDYETEIFNGDGINSTFTLTSTPLNDSYFEYKIDTTTVEGTYDSLTNEVTFPSIIQIGQTATVEWYFAGQFTDDFVDIVQSILSKLLVVRWCEKEKNFLLDIRRLLFDTDFKLHDSSGINRAKVSWYDDMREEAEKLMAQYAWSRRFKRC